MFTFQTNYKHYCLQRAIFQKFLYIRISTNIFKNLKYSANKKLSSFASHQLDIFFPAFTEGKSTCTGIKMQQCAQDKYITRTSCINQNIPKGVKCGWCMSRMFKFETWKLWVSHTVELFWMPWHLLSTCTIPVSSKTKSLSWQFRLENIYDMWDIYHVIYLWFFLVNNITYLFSSLVWCTLSIVFIILRVRF